MIPARTTVHGTYWLGKVDHTSVALGPAVHRLGTSEDQLRGIQDLAMEVITSTEQLVITKLLNSPTMLSRLQIVHV